MATLEIFPNLSLYRLEAEIGSVTLPKNLSDITVFDRDNLTVSYAEIENETNINLGDYVKVDDEEGSVYDISEDYITIIKGNQTLRIREPKKIISVKSTLGKTLTVETPSVISGFIRDLFWVPIYVIVLSKDPDQITNLTLSALINASSQYPFSVSRIIFNAMSTLREERLLLGMTQAKMAEPKQVSLDLLHQYSWNNPTNIKGQLTIPLDSFTNIKVPRLYFLTLSQESKPSYGYMFEVSYPMPTGQVKVYDLNLGFVGFTTLDMIGQTVILKIAPERNLLAQVIVEKHHPEQEIESTRQKIEYNVKITSKLDSPITLALELPVYGKVLSTDPQPSLRLSGKLYWFLSVAPGENTVQGEVTLLA